MSDKEKVCLNHMCSECCNPVKMKQGFKAHQGTKLNELPFEERDDLLIPETEIDTTRLESFDCKLFDEKTGQCKDYKNRPKICRQTECKAFETNNEQEQKEIIAKIKNEKFICQKRK
ncbi:MAG: YkgJ family cysteine cluster protein [Candidatus Uhrbacteria bacterium]